MKPRTKKPTRPIHVTLPIRLLHDFDETLRYNQSRSAKIASLIAQDMQGGATTIREATTRQLFAALHAREDVDMLMKSLILQVLTQ